MCVVGSAFAAPVDYQFLGIVGTRDTDGGQKLPPQLTPDARFGGALTFDPALTEPVVSLRLTVNGTEILNSQGHHLTSKLETQNSSAGVESLLFTAVIDLEQDNRQVQVQFSWASPGQGQLPADPHTVDITALHPYAWKVALIGDDLVCETGCVSLAERVDAHMLGFGRAGSDASYAESFSAAPPHWTNTGGNWTAQSGYYTNAGNVAFTSSIYDGETLQPFVEVSADLYSGFVNSGNALGLLLNYRDANNFREVRFTANGVVQINQVTNGVRTMVATGRYSVPPQTFFHVSVLSDFGTIDVQVNNQQTLRVDSERFPPGSMLDGRAGVFASWNKARVDNFTIQELSGWNVDWNESFSSETNLQPQSGTWVVDNGVYRNTSNQAAAISTLPPPMSTFMSFTDDFAAYARIRLTWSSSGNRGGLVYDFRNLQNYRAVLVSAKTATRAGKVEVIEVVNGVSRVIVSSTDTQLAAGQWGEISVVRADDIVRVAVTGMLAPYLTFHQDSIGGEAGVIGSWNLVRFDDFVFNAQSGPI
jgi:hypothetical protein